MFEDIVLIHRQAERDPAPFVGVDLGNWVIWKTCVRQIAIGSSPQKVAALFVKKTDEVYTGSQAYQFFLEVVCGLHSPVLGETEIMGQFRELVAEMDSKSKSASTTPVQSLVQKFLNAALADTKLVRDTHLRDLGNRSYGSLLRRQVSGSESLNIIGAGKLVHEILPWLVSKAPKTNIYCRRREQGLDLKKEFKKIQVRSWPLNHTSEKKVREKSTWIIAAPLSGKQIQDALEGVSDIVHVVDLRDHSKSDPVHFRGVRVLRLHEFFNQIAGTQKEVETKATLARELIGSLVVKRFRTVEIRPFGWEDLCG